MHLIKGIRAFILLIAFVSFLASYASADGDAVTEAQLQSLKTEIKKLDKWLVKANQDESVLKARLGELEVGISRSTQQTARLKIEIEKLAIEKNALIAQQSSLELNIGQQKQEIERLIEASYKTGEKNRLKLILDQGDPVYWMRMLTYYQQVSQIQLSQLTNYQTNLSRLAQVKLELETKIQASQVASVKLAKERQLLQQQKNNRTQVLTALRNEIQSVGQKLEAKKADRARLETLLARVVVAIEKLVPNDLSLPFSSLKGKMHWPVGRANVSQRFGESIGNGPLKSQGIVLSLPNQANVNAVHHGRVVFADWLNGYGLLLILDHGDGYMSLYARNEVLMRSVGEWVNAGDQVAVSGGSGFSEPGLYFEIRKNGLPQNPISWLARR